MDSYFKQDMGEALGGPVLHQILIFFGAHCSNLIICIENKLCKVIDNSLNCKWLRPALTFYIVKFHFYWKKYIFTI